MPIVEAILDRELGIGYYEKDAEANRMYWGENLQGLCLISSRKMITEFEAEEKAAQTHIQDDGRKTSVQDSQNDIEGNGQKSSGQDGQNGL